MSTCVATTNNRHDTSTLCWLVMYVCLLTLVILFGLVSIANVLRTYYIIYCKFAKRNEVSSPLRLIAMG